MRLSFRLPLVLLAACGSVSTTPDASTADAPMSIDGASAADAPPTPDAPPGTPDAPPGTPDAELAPKIAFVTNGVFIGGTLGGLDGADAQCQTAADNVAPPLPGLYRAWLSDSTGSPSTRFVQYAGPYQRTDGVRIANSWADLTDGTLLAPLDKTEAGAQSNGNQACGPGEIWTNTTAQGTVRSSNDCIDWTSQNATAPTGLVASTTATWTDNPACLNAGCGARIPLYCFQQ